MLKTLLRKERHQSHIVISYHKIFESLPKLATKQKIAICPYLTTFDTTEKLKI